jgi:hypothetical protein
MYFAFIVGLWFLGFVSHRRQKVAAIYGKNKLISFGTTLYIVVVTFFITGIVIIGILQTFGAQYDFITTISALLLACSLSAFVERKMVSRWSIKLANDSLAGKNINESNKSLLNEIDKEIDV